MHFNTGWNLTERLSNRTWLSWTDLFFHIPNVVPKPRIYSDPRGVLGDQDTPQDNLLNVYRRDPLRDTQHRRIANLTRWQGDVIDQSLGLWWQRTDDLFKNPTTHNLTDTDTWGAQWQMQGRAAAFDYRFALSYTDSDGEREQYANNPQNGTRLQRFGHYDLQASSLDLVAALGWNFAEDWQLLADAKWSRVERDARRLDGAARLDQRYRHASPRLGVIWNLHQDWRLFANLSRSNEAPTWWEIIAEAVPPNNPAAAQSNMLRLRTQKADSVELGMAANFGHAESGGQWSLVLYRSAVEDELMAMVDESGNRTGTFNYAAGTTHQGVEAGLSGHWGFADEEALEYRLSWTHSDFTFDAGQYSGNQIAGVPRNLISAELAQRAGGWRIGPNLRWLPNDTPTDHANTRDNYQDSYTLFGFGINYTSVDGRWSAFLHADNIGDTRYASSYVIRQQAAFGQPTFLPGVGRNATLGVTWRF